MNQFFVELALNFVSLDHLNSILSDPRTVATLVGALVAVSGALLGTFLLLRQMSLTTDAISHTILLGIVVAFLVMVGVFGMEPDLSSPWLIIGAAVAGVATVVLTEALQRTGIVKADAALGLAFPFLFAISIILVSRFTEDVHLDTDSVVVGEIGIAWANTSSVCLERCEDVVVTPEHPAAEVARTCVNCAAEGISPRDARAVFEETCSNCGTYTAVQAFGRRLTSEQPIVAFIPKALGVMGVITLLNAVFVGLFYKELKLATFDAGLARALGFRPGMLHYALMILVSVTAVGAFDAVGAILVVAFFVIPPATAFLLTRRLSAMLTIAPVIGALAAYTGYDLAQGRFLGIISIDGILRWLDPVIGLDGYTTWNVSISASIVLMMFAFLVLAWVFSPQSGLIARAIRRRQQTAQFHDYVVLGHIANHLGTAEAYAELALPTLHEHFHWSPLRMRLVLARLRARQLISYAGEHVELTQHGRRALSEYRYSANAAPTPAT
jgi:manganese/zinc/iron transport system permease protein